MLIDTATRSGCNIVFNVPASSVTQFVGARSVDWGEAGEAAHPIIRIWTLNRPRLHWSICDQSPERDFLILIFVPHQLHGQHVPGRDNDFYCPQVHDPVEQQPTANGPQPMASTGILHVIIQGRAYSLWIIQLHK